MTKKINYIGNRKKGFSLIELIIVISIISILSLSIVNYIKSYNYYENKIYVDECDNSILMFINRAKMYCKSKQCSGLIIFDKVSNAIDFYENNTKHMDAYALPEGFALNSITLGSGKVGISINNKGITVDACSIVYIDRYNNSHKLTISVGTAYVEIK